MATNETKMTRLYADTRGDLERQRQVAIDADLVPRGISIQD